MSRPLVIDASVGIGCIGLEPWSERAKAVIVERVAAGIVVPRHFWLEIVNVLARRYGHTGQEIIEAVHELDDSQIQTIESDRAALLLVIDLVERHGLTAYDAEYLALALRTDADLATADRQLALAAGDRAILFGPQEGIAEARAAYRTNEVTWPEWPAAGAYLAELRADAIRAMREEQSSPA